MKTLFHLKKQKTFAILCISSISYLSYSQEITEDSLQTKTIHLEEISISGIRANHKTPVTFSNLSKDDVKTRNLGQDIPTLLNLMPSVVMTSDAGNGIGYSGIRVRGSDATRVNITLNGIPYNDSESHQTYWVNMPDLISSVNNIQIQRGVGTSTNGSGAFGASINLQTDEISETAFGEISNSFGSYNSRKHTLKFGSGLLNNRFEISGRISQIKSDGYIDRAWSDMNAYFLQGIYKDEKRQIKAITFGGKQQTYQAWNGLEDLEKLQYDRTYNIAGEMYDDAGNLIGYYKNEVDNYNQDHYQLHWNEFITDNWSTNFALHYTIGKGYYENYKSNQKLADYGLTSESATNTDLIRQKWLENDFYGLVFSGNYQKNNWNVILGGGYHIYEGDHFGKILWTKEVLLPSYPSRYYFDSAKKTDFNLYAKANYQITEKWNVFADLQQRNVSYKANAIETGNVNDMFHFFNPKFGITYTVNQRNNIYVSYAKANREPNRDDYENSNPKPESLDDYELGWRYASNKIKLNVNTYYMRYKNQLVLTGALNDVGAPIRENSGNSYRLGIETDAKWMITDKIILQPSISVSQNKNIDFITDRNGTLTNLGNTNIAFSPSLVASNAISYLPIENLQISLLSKYVSDQYMSNLDLNSSKLKNYLVNDINASYTYTKSKLFKEITISALVNNILNKKYISNGYFYSYDDTWSNPNQVSTIDGAGYFPQATRNFLVGISLLF